MKRLNVASSCEARAGRILPCEVTMLTGKARADANRVKVSGWDPRYRDDFVRLNEAWVTRYFAVEESDRRIEVRKGDRAPDGPRLRFRYQEESWIRPPAEVSGHLMKLLTAHRIEPPVGAPCLVVDHPGPLDLRVEVPKVELPNVDSSPLGPAGYSTYLVENEETGRPIVGEKDFRCPQPDFLEKTRVIRRIVGHLDCRGFVESFHQHSAGVVGRELDGTQHPIQPALSKPVAGFAEEGPRYVRIIDHLEKTEEPEAIA
ncbi:MAG: hypothetical protein IH969_07315, partial [Candidatus Krumholzibacteriota bacterium]|nr:hypothetical protein [Candidatus Krumholzibacteriota bacterium]